CPQCHPSSPLAGVQTPLPSHSRGCSVPCQLPGHSLREHQHLKGAWGCFCLVQGVVWRLFHQIPNAQSTECHIQAFLGHLQGWGLLDSSPFPWRNSFLLVCGSGRWHKLHSKAGKKEKERGEILVSLQFTRNSLTASMFDLSVKDKARSPFGKLKDKVTGKKKYDLESASAIIPSSMAALDMEDDFELGGKKSKLKGFFLKNKLRRSSLTQSSTSLGSDSTISSASLSLAGTVPEVPKSPSRHSSLSTELKELLASPKLSHKRAFSDDVSQVSPAELEPRAPPSPQPRRDPASRSSLCINGSHVYGEEAAPRNPPGSAPLPVPRRQDEPLGFTPLHTEPHEVPWGLGSLERAQQRDEPRFIPSPPSLALQEELKVSTKAVTLSNHLGRARMEESTRLEGKASPAAPALGFPTEPAKDRAPEDTRKEDKKAKGGFFHHGGKGQGDRGTPVHASAAGDERSKSSGWFGSKEPKESPQKPSPHPVKPLSAVQEGSSERKQQPRGASLSSALSNGLERLKTVTTSSVQPLAPASQPDKTDPKLKDPAQLDQSAKYYHLTHDELIQLLLQKEGELSKKEEHIHELENYIDQLLVRIMEQSPTLLQIPLGGAQAP
uniref:RAB11 family interacting protein 5 n=1 Tax=Serinus canaria TaxID=9135 RepID=A0A8C9NR55_SERCA